MQKYNIFQYVRYFMAIAGMIRGNIIERNIIALNSFYKSLQRKKRRCKLCFGLLCNEKRGITLNIACCFVSDKFSNLRINSVLSGKAS